MIYNSNDIDLYLRYILLEIFNLIFTHFKIEVKFLSATIFLK